MAATDPISKASTALCFQAQTFLENGTTINKDVGGPFVTVANIIINVLLPFLIRWSSDVSSSILFLFSQTIPVLLSTLSSIHQKSLTLYDAHNAAALSLSPTMLYIATCCILHRCGVETSLFRKVSSPEVRVIILWLGLALPLLWFATSITTSFSTSAYTNSKYCQGMSVQRYLAFLFVSSMTGVLDILGYRDLWDDLLRRRGLGLVFLLGLWLWAIYLVKHREEIVQQWLERYQELVDEDSRCRLLKQSLILAWNVPRVCWDVVMKHHPSMMWAFLVLVHWSWVLGILNSITFDSDLSYGEFLSCFSVTPALYSSYRLIQHNWRTIGRFFVKIPVFVSNGLCFVITGKQEWTERPTEPKRDYFQWPRWRWGIILLGWFAYTASHVVWIYFYVRGGTLPNERNATNEPHSNWKPFRCTSTGTSYPLSIFVFVAGVDYYQKLFFSRHLDGQRRSPSSRVLRSLGLTALILVAIVFTGGPLFSGFIALPSSQSWHWIHQCSSYPVEMIFNSEANSSLSSTISFYVATDQQYPPQRQHVYDFVFSNVPGTRYKVLQYRPIANTTLSQELEPSIKTMFFDMSQRNFFGCSSSYGSLHDNVTQLESCSDAVGLYTEDPYLSFSITTAGSPESPPTTTFLRVLHREYKFTNGAPAFNLRYANADGSITGRTLLISALTKRNSPSTLKVCSNEAGTVTTLGPAGLFLTFLNQFAGYIHSPRVFSMD